MKKILFAWLGHHDIKVVTTDHITGNESDTDTGPIARAAIEKEFNSIIILCCDISRTIQNRYQEFLSGITSAKLVYTSAPFKDPTDYSAIYEFAKKTIEKFAPHEEDVQRTFHLSPGTSIMATTWILLANTQFAAELIQSDEEHGVSNVYIPFDISAEYLGDLQKKSDAGLIHFSQSAPPAKIEFAKILYRSKEMEEIVSNAARIAVRNVPVLIHGESGTGKELFARAIHNSSGNKEGKFVAINCGAIPESLMESELFGYKKGAFTGANTDKPGYIELADNGTLFLDEVAEMPLHLQVKLLRVLQEEEIQRIGDTKQRKIKFRLISATNKNLENEVNEGGFREDLYYRIAVFIIQLPPLRQRTGDIGLLIDYILNEINHGKIGPGYCDKKISAAGKNLLLQQPWPGNYRQLNNTILRAAMYNDNEVISQEDIEKALMPSPANNHIGILDAPLGETFDMKKVLNKVRKYYAEKALEAADRKITHTPQFLGGVSYQIVKQWLEG